MVTRLLTLAAALSAVLHILAEYGGPAWQVYLFKPLTMGFILALALRAWLPARPRYGTAVLAGLLCSLAGDVFLMLPSDRFIPGLVCFLAAHLCYIVAFRSGLPPGRGAAWLPLPFLLYAAAMVGSLYPSLGPLKVPVMVYAAVIACMGWQAGLRFHRVRDRASGLALAGALLFIVSDSLLAWDRFRGRFAAAPALLLGTYFTAQWLLARSVAGGPAMGRASEQVPGLEKDPDPGGAGP